VDIDITHVGEAALNEGAEALDGGTATGEDHVLSELVVVFGVGAGDELLHVLHDGVHDGFARTLHAVGDVEGHGLAFNGEVNEHGLVGGRCRHEGKLLLPATGHVLGDLGAVVLGRDLLDELVVDEVASVAGVHLVTGARNGPVDTAQIGGPCTDVNDEGVGDHVKGVSDGERLGDDHGGVDRAGSSVEDGCLVHVAGLGGCTDDCHNAVVLLGVGQADEVGDEVGNVFTVFGRVLDDTEFKRAVQVESQTVLQRLVTEQDITLEEVSRNGVFGRTDDGQFFHFVTVGRDHHGTECPQIDSNVQRFVGHEIAYALHFMKGPLSQRDHNDREVAERAPKALL